MSQDRLEESKAAEPGTPAAIWRALGESIAYEEFKGDFAAARPLAEAQWETAQQAPQLETLQEALLWQVIVHWLSGELTRAVEGARQAQTLAGADANRALRALSYQLIAGYERFNAFPDGAGASAIELSARWQTATDLLPLNAEWHALLQRSSEPAAQMEAWLVFQFLWNLWPARNTLEMMRYTPAAASCETLLPTFLDAPQRLRALAEANAAAPLAAFADWTAADLWRRAGNLQQADALLERARATYHDAGDKAGEALCLMTRADWQCAPYSTPLAWNFAIVDSSSQAGHLVFQQEADEFKVGVEVSYAETEALFAQANAPRGLAAIQLRHGYQAMRRDDWAAAARHAAAAWDEFARCGDARGRHLAATHLLMCQLAAPALPHAGPLTLARDIGAWGAASGSFSFALGLGILLQRFARHWLTRHGDYERALATSAAARALYEALGARINAAQCLADQGVAYQIAGERTAALTLFEQALDEYGAAVAAHPAVAENLRQRVVFLATDVYQLSLQQTDAGGMERAAARLQRQLTAGIEFAPLAQMAEDIVKQCAVLAPLYRARWQRNAGDEPGAARCLEQAAQAAEQAPAGERHYLEAVVLAEQRRYEAAAAAARRHLAAGGADAGFVGELTEWMKQHGGALGQAQAALQLTRTHNQAFSLFVMIKQYAEAARHLRMLETLAGKEWWRAEAKPWQALSDCAEMYAGLNELAQALACYDQAIAQLEARRAQLSRDELKTALASDKGAQFLYFLAARTALRAGDAARAFAYAEQGKARALLDLMAEVRGVSSATETAALRDWRQANAQLALRRGWLAQLRTQSLPDATRLAAVEAQVAESEAELHRVEAELARSHPRFHAALTAPSRTLTLAEVQAALPPQTALLEYYFLGEDLLAWAITNDGVQSYQAPLEAAQLARRIGAFHRACQTRGTCEALGAELSETLLAPFATAIRATRQLIVVPYGAAHLLPFHALPFDGQPLAASHAVSYLPSASTLQFSREDVSEPLPEKILVVGNPTGDLTAAEAEAEFVAAQFPQALLLKNAEATAARVRDCLADYPLLHFATHGRLAENAPLESALSFAGGERLTVYDLMGLSLQARLVVLSACDTARGETTGSDDVLGLARALLAAGAQAVIVSLWPVDDASTSWLMREFYRCLRQGDTPQRALWQAQNQMRQMTEEKMKEELSAQTQHHQRHLSATVVTLQSAVAVGYRHPFHWAPFILVGHI